MADQPPPPYSDVNTPPEEAEGPLPPDTPSGLETTSGYPPETVVGQPSPQVAYPFSGYPPQQAPGYPSQQMGHPSEQAGYPPQQQGYPSQQGGYPPQPASAPIPWYQQQKGHPPVATGYPPQGQSTNTVTVTQQPQVTTTIVPIYVNDYMGLSVFTCLCCCCCIGLFAIMKSTESRSFSRAGSYEQAVASAITARNLGYASLIFGLFIYVGFIIGILI